MNKEQITDTYPLSPMQEGMLFHSLSAREPGVDVEQIYCTLPESLGVAAFERAWQLVVERQAILRTTFHWEGLSEPRQVVQPHAAVEFKFEDWRGTPPAEQADRFETALQTDRRRGFRLSEVPGQRVALFRLGESKYRLLWTFHHLLLDGRAVVMVFNEVFAFYEAFVRGDDLELPPPPRYRDYIEWLRHQDLSAAETFWRQTLKGFTTPAPIGVVRLAAEAAGSGDIDIRGEQEIDISESVTATLKSLARKNGLTPNTLLQGAWSLLLSRYSREDDIVFGAIRACRRSDLPAAGATVGLFINTVPMRVRIEPGMSLISWLQTLRESWKALRDHEHTPLVNIQGWSEAPRGRPLFETIFNFQDPSWDAALRAQGGPWAKREFGIRSQSNYPLVVDAYGGQAFLVKILYHRDRFDDATITRMLGHFKMLLEGMAADLEMPVGRLPMLTKAERQQLLVEWNRTAAEFPRDKCIHELFEEQVERTPDALAVTDGRQRLTYRELNKQADHLASQLRARGVGPDVCVGVCLERSAGMVAALLAVWKAGGAYVPLDPSYPPERLAFMLADARMPALLTSQSLRDRLKFEIPEVEVVCVDDAHRASIPGSGFRAPHSRDLAYVIYTSGSTGQPKGVEIEHRSLANLIAWHQRAYQVTPADRATQVATPAFDASVWELWPYLTAGASIHIPDEETRFSPEKLVAWLTENKITLAFIPTPVAEAMLAEAWPDGCTLRALLTGGDKLHRRPGKNLPVVLVNHYGPTENTVVTTASLVPPGETNALPPIGRPIANTRVYILDPNFQPVPVGVPGELYVGGIGLARGYHHHPELTAEKFVLNPFGAEPDAFLYQTGDRVRWLPDGQIEFLGRLDDQVKVRGHRIEPVEIEAALNRHPAVRESVVMVRADDQGENRLAAWVVSWPEQRVSPYELREFLKQKLPHYMVPATFTVLEAFPLTPNGKVDRKALPAPVVESAAEFIAPRTPTEQKLADIWCEVLGVTQAGVHDNFFELGGHSLMATQAIARIHNVFQIELPLRHLFDAPSLAGLAGKIDEARDQSGKTTTAPPLTHSQRDEQRPLSFAQERLWFVEQMEPGIPFNNIPVAIRIDGKLDIIALQHALNELVRRHETFRTVFTNHGGQPVAMIASARSFAVPVIDVSTLPRDRLRAEAQRFMDEAARQPFDLAQDTLLRARLLRLAAEEHLLLLTTHHIACDGWSLGVFYRELTALYAAGTQGQTSPLPGSPVEYADFADWQRQWLKGAILEAQLAFWGRQLEGAPMTLDLPADRPRPARQSYRGATKCFALPGKLAAGLAQLSRQEDATLFMVLLAALQTLLHRYSGQEDILVGSPAAGRTRVETENLVGFFLNTLVLRGDLSGDPTFRDLLKRVRRTALDAYAHQDLPFEKLVEALQPERDLSRSPLFQVMFVLQNEPLRPLELAGLKLNPVHTHSGAAKFDLMFSLEEVNNGLGGFVEYNTDLFDEPTIARMLGHFQTLLEGMVADPGIKISELPLLTPDEREQMLVKWNDTRAEFPRDKCLHELIGEQARRTPEAVAVVFDDEQITYRELNERADRLAAELRGAGVGPEVRVGICMERSLEMMVGLLGILKAGGGYVPLDPAYPMERLAFMLEDSQASVLVTQPSLRDHFKFEISNLKVLCADDAHRESRTRTKDEDEQTDSTPHSELRTPNSDNLAYVLYTSGSTGRPKGVMVTHRNVVNFFTGMDHVLGTQPGVWLAVTSISFDISVLELFWTLARGFKVVIQPDEKRSRSVARVEDAFPDGQRSSVSEQIVRQGVTHLQCTPSLAGALALAPESLKAMRSLDKLLLGGEALPVSLARQLRQVLRGELINMYGPTETTVWSATHRVAETGNAIPIGRPIANTVIYLLDRNLQPVPAGVPGEIFIGGEGVTRGYLNRPELTAGRFINNPFGNDHDSRLYRTGDLGRFRADGTIEFLGRLDHQVKIRGHRIELGEIESALAGHPAVRETVVVAREESPGDQRLVAYAVLKTKLATNELRRFLEDKLPEVMMPSAFVLLEKLPLTPNGKVNRKALPAPPASRPGLETAYVAPGTAMENAIARIWQELLHVEKVGLHDNFFDLGGHSLLVVQAQALLHDRLGIYLPVVKLFQYPTVHLLAGFLNESGPVSLEKINNRGRRKQAAFAQRRKQEDKVLA